MAFSNRVRSALTTTVLATAATGFLAGCGSEEEEQVAYCTDEDGEIVDDDYCDDDYRGGGGGGLFFLYLGAFRPGLPVGTGAAAAGAGGSPAWSSAWVGGEVPDRPGAHCRGAVRGGAPHGGPGQAGEAGPPHLR